MGDLSPLSPQTKSSSANDHHLFATDGDANKFALEIYALRTSLVK
jgi:hypothetical protein